MDPVRETDRLLVVGKGPVSDALVPMALELGWEAVVATSMDEVTRGLPRAKAVVVTSHDSDVDGPALAAALAARPPYIGAMGSRRTQARRQEWLLANGHTETDLEPVHGPAGIDIGADGPAEIALSILAEMVATLRGRTDVGSLKNGAGPIHPGLGPGEAFCPTG